MTGRTHDLAAVSFSNAALVFAAFPVMSLGTLLVALIATILGGMAPDLDQPTASFWKRIPIIGQAVAYLVHPLTGGHRIISHSLLGMALVGFFLKYVLAAMNSFLLVDMHVVWWAFMIGMASHLFMDMLTKEGTPWLFPIPIRFGFPPFRFMRLTTGGMLEKGVIFPALIIGNGLLCYSFYPQYVEYIRHLF